MAYPAVLEEMGTRFDETSLVKNRHQLCELLKLKTQTSCEVVVFETIGVECCFTTSVVSGTILTQGSLRVGP